MTDTEIIKALECCKMPVGSGACNGCSLKNIRNKRLTDKDKSCTTILLENAIDLINRQKAEIERLSKMLDDKCDRCIERERTEAIKEFAERLKTDYGELVYSGDVNKIVKEMAGDAE